MPLARALSKRGLCSRSDAIALVLAGRVSVDGVVRRDPGLAVVPERAQFAIDQLQGETQAWRCLAFHKPRGVVTTRRDGQGRPTVHDVLGEQAARLQAVGRLDLATSGLLLLTNDSRFGDWLTDPSNGVPRTYLVTVRGLLPDRARDAMVAGVEVESRTVGLERLAAASVIVRKRSGRETHLVVTLTEGRNREVRRLCSAVGHDVARLARVAYGPIDLGTLAPGEWREITRDEAERAFPGARFSTAVRPAGAHDGRGDRLP